MEPISIPMIVSQAVRTALAPVENDFSDGSTRTSILFQLHLTIQKSLQLARKEYQRHQRGNATRFPMRMKMTSSRRTTSLRVEVPGVPLPKLIIASFRLISLSSDRRTRALPDNVPRHLTARTRLRTILGKTLISRRFLHRSQKARS
jgi:hypothetical protein